MKTIAFFDFDGTLTTKDTLLDFTRYAFGNIKFLSGLLAVLPFAILAGLNLMHRDAVARRFIFYFYKNKPAKDIEKMAESYTRNRLPHLMNAGVYKKFLNHRQKKDEIVVVSASPSVWLDAWSRQHQTALIATQLEVIDGVFTGKITGARCNGIHKVSRIRETYDLGRYDTVFAYGNSKGDLPMLEMADTAFYYTGTKLKSFRSRQAEA